MRLKLVAVILAVCSMSCAVTFQRSVRSSSVYCSTSRFWYLFDFLLAGSYVYAMTRVPKDFGAKGYIPAGVFGGSGLIGVYKRSNCVKWRKEAPPEVWAAAAEAARLQAEADERARAEAAAAYALAQQQQLEQQQQLAQQWQEQQQQQQQQQQPVVIPDRPVPVERYRPPPPTGGGSPTVIIERKQVSSAKAVARTHPDCEQQIPPSEENNDFGMAAQMTKLKREPCHRCIDSGKVFSIYGFKPLQSSCN